MRNMFYSCKEKAKHINHCKWIQEFRTKWKFKKFILIFLMFLLMFTLYEHLNHNIFLQNKQNSFIARNINLIRIAIEDMALSSPYQSQQKNQNILLNKINFLHQRLLALEIKIDSFDEKINTRLNTFQQLLSQPKEEKPYLDANALPFHVISIDTMDGKSYVSVDYANHITPLTKGGWLGGWQVVQADCHSSVAVFGNEKKQYVKVHLKEVLHA